MCGFEYVGENVSVFENLYVGAITIDPMDKKVIKEYYKELQAHKLDK